MKTILLVLLLPITLFAANSPDTAAPIRPLTLPAAARASNLVAELRWTQDGTTIPVPAGLQVTAKIMSHSLLDYIS